MPNTLASQFCTSVCFENISKNTQKGKSLLLPKLKTLSEYFDLNIDINVDYRSQIIKYTIFIELVLIGWLLYNQTLQDTSVLQILKSIFFQAVLLEVHTIYFEK